MPSWCQPTPQLWMPLTNLCQGRTDWRGEIRSSIVKPLIESSAVDMSCLTGAADFDIFSSGQFRPERLQLRTSPGPGLGSDVWRWTLPCPPSTFCQNRGRALPCQSNNRREGAVLRVTVCRYPSNPHVWRHMTLKMKLNISDMYALTDLQVFLISLLGFSVAGEETLSSPSEG